MKKFLFLWISLIISACTLRASPSPTVAPTVTAYPSDTPTPTIVWFPPTATSTPLPELTATPTDEEAVKFGQMIYQDFFISTGDWFIPRSGRGEIHVEDGELNIIVNEPRSLLFSVLEAEKFGNFYAEITASPRLCSGKDEYGMMIRASRAERYYRFSLSCDGYIRFDRILGQNVISLQPWMRSASVPTAAPSDLRLGVWAEGNEIRLYVNGMHQFTIQDDQIGRGSLGVFARAAGDTAVTVSFSELVVHEASP